MARPFVAGGSPSGRTCLALGHRQGAVRQSAAGTVSLGVVVKHRSVRAPILLRQRVAPYSVGPYSHRSVWPPPRRFGLIRVGPGYSHFFLAQGESAPFLRLWL